MENYFKKLNDINVNDKTEKKNGLTYLSWAWAWGEVKKLFPDSTYTIYEDPSGCFYHTDGKTCWVKTGVTVNGVEHIEYLPVMDFKNRSIPLEQITSFDVNKTIQRSLTKAVARHGLGLYVYAGEDLPESENPKGSAPEQKPGFVIPPDSDEPVYCENCGKRFADYWDGEKLIKAAELAERSKKMNGQPLCPACAKKR